MKSQTPCERCGLRAVRYELERNGVIVRFCDDCYWGEVQGDGTSRGSDGAKKSVGLARTA